MTVHSSPSTVRQDSNAPRCYLVTGVAGFIASKVAEQLLAAGHTVVGVDNLNDYYDIRLKYYRLARLAELSGCEASQVASIKEQVTRSAPQVCSAISAKPPSGLFASVSQSENRGQTPGGQEPATAKFQVSRLKSARFEFHVLDIENLAALDALFAAQKFEAVFNLAARAGVRYSMENPHVYLSTNTLGTLNILECQRKYGVKKQVLASTSSLYAGCPMPFTEDQPVNTPLSPYAATKKAAEMLAYSYHKLYGLDISVVRYFTVFGPAGRPDMAPLRFIKWIDEGTPITLYGDGTQSRDFTYVDDIARGTILAAKPLGYEIVNLGGGRNPITLQTVIAFIEKALTASRQSAVDSGQSDSLDRSPTTGHRQRVAPVKAIINGQPFHVADIKETWADITKAERLLGWTPQISPEQGFQLSVDWHVANRAWLKDIRL